MLRRSKIITLLFLLLYVNNFPQAVTRINFTGNKVFSQSEYLSWSNTLGKKYYPSTIDTIKKNVAGELAARGYFFPRVDNTGVLFSDDSSSVFLMFNINEEEPAYVNKINLEGADSLLSAQLISAFGYIEGSIYNKSEIENNIAETLQYLENNGYPFASVKVISAYIYTDSSGGIHYADIILDVNPDQKSKIDKIEISGNTSTEEYVILRELRIRQGENYSQKLIEDIPGRLNRLRFFEPVPEPEFYINSKSEGVLRLTVKEKQTNNFDGIVGYVPGTAENQKGYVTGLVDVTLRNLFGTGRAAAIHWQQVNRYSQELELRYLEPWIFTLPFNINGRLFQRKQDTSYVQRTWEAGVEYLATNNISASVTVSSENIIPALNENNIFSVFNSASFTSGISLTIDTRDDPYSPLSGIIFINGYSFSRKKIYGPQQYFYPGLETSINLQRVTLDFSGFYQLFSRQVVALGVHGRELRGNFFEISDLFKLGGTNSLRGYREEQFAGSRIFWSNLEYRLLLTRRSFAFLFFDLGYYLRSQDLQRNIQKQEAFKYGYGLGLNIETGLGVLGVSFALAQGNSFSDGVIHFGLVNEF